MNWFHRGIAAVMLALWLPATSLCLVERAGWLASDDCCPVNSCDSPSNAPANDSACCLLASANYKLDEQARISVPDALWPVNVPPIVDQLLAESAVLSGSSPAPPDLAVTWQFTNRAALLPRAPSVPS